MSFFKQGLQGRTRSNAAGWFADYGGLQMVEGGLLTRNVLEQIAAPFINSRMREVRRDLRALVNARSRANRSEVRAAVNIGQVATRRRLSSYMWISSKMIDWDRIRVTRPRRGPLKIALYRGAAAPARKGAFVLHTRGKRVIMIRSSHNSKRVYTLPRPTFARHVSREQSNQILERHFGGFGDELERKLYARLEIALAKHFAKI